MSIKIRRKRQVNPTPPIEYLEHWRRIDGGSRDWSDMTKVRARYTSRRECIEQYAFAIPNQEALDTIARFSPIVELGAGTGYWCYLLRQMGVQVVAMDAAPVGGPIENTYEFKKAWVDVAQGGPADLVDYASHALMLCWPNYNTSFASDALRAYAGETLIYVGEGRGGCTGDAEFHEMIDASWTKIATVYIPQWDGIHDELHVYKRGTS